jgi:hypothetical protein
MHARGRLTLLATLIVPALTPACSKGESKPSSEPAASAEPAAPSGGQAKYEDPAFELVMRPASEFVAGKPGVVEIQVEARGGYHMNDTYPYRFKTAASDGVKFGAPVFEKSAMQLEAARGTMKVDVTPESAGAKSVSGMFHFSVCSADRCLVEKRELKLPLAVN